MTTSCSQTPIAYFQHPCAVLAAAVQPAPVAYPRGARTPKDKRRLGAAIAPAMRRLGA